VKKFGEWGIGLDEVVIAAPFNKVGFQMVPSVEENEKMLGSLSSPVVIGISVLAAGRLSLENAADYVRSLPNIKGVAIGISREKQAAETFSTFKKIMSTEKNRV
jgi:hypothetical protein